MNNDEIQAIKDDLAAITPYPWFVDTSGLATPFVASVQATETFVASSYDMSVEGCQHLPDPHHQHPDAVFIAAAPERIAALVAEVEESRKALIASTGLALELVEELALKCDDPIHDQQLLELAQQAAELRGNA